ncbi:isochorismatase family protein [Teredinibacter franksiae]|uniref:isochorismatase family protein n=1 Tax=Teredinibacter franksiae TaxID=2761453 RepID=UPI0016288548|nr:isochorismatase family protein [Teredinibacter franksiae]
MSIPALPEYTLNQIVCNQSNKPGWQVDPSRAVLLIHDMQRYFVNFYGNDSAFVSKLIVQIQQLKNWCASNGIPCAYTAQPGNQNPEERALLTDFWGGGLNDDPDVTGIVSGLAPVADDKNFTKWRYSAFKKNNFDKWLRASNRDQIIIVGVYGHIGILSTALEAFMLDYQPFIVADAIGDFSLEDHQYTLDYVAKRCGVVTDVSTLTAGSAVKLQADTAFYSHTAIRKCVADIIYETPDVIPTNENLLDYGLDSIRLITLLEVWQAEGVTLDFSEFASTMTIESWSAILQREAEAVMRMPVEVVA